MPPKKIVKKTVPIPSTSKPVAKAESKPEPKPEPKIEVAQPDLIVPGRRFDIVQLSALVEQTRSLADSYETVFEEFTPEMTVSQRLMRASIVGARLVEQAARFDATFKKFALGHRLCAGGFQHEADPGEPLLVITFPTSGGAVAPSWKNEALKLGEELAKKNGVPWDAKAFEEKIRAGTTPSAKSTSVKLVEAG
jgi:hypothetical protein